MQTLKKAFLYWLGATVFFISANAFIYYGAGIAENVFAEPSPCVGWNCDKVSCPNGYAVRLPSGSYLKCEDFDEYIDDNKSVNLMGVEPDE